MGLRIRTNVQSLNAQRHLGEETFQVARSSERLASGYRINRAADDAAGFAIAGVLGADVRSLNQARRNANDGISLIEVADAGLAEINNIMVRLRELSIQAASDTIGQKERGFLNQEFFQLKDEIDRIALSTEFNGTRLLTGQGQIHEELLTDHNYSPLEVQVGKDYYVVSDAIEQKNPINIIKLNLQNMNALTDGENSLGIGGTTNESGTRIDQKQTAQLAIDTLDGAMQKVAAYRADLGALQNRLEKTDKAISIYTESLSAAQSRIKDVDFAAETSNMTQHSILQKAGVAMLTQANALPNIALRLLEG